MYTNDKNKRITLRLNEQQFAFVEENSKILGVSPSDFLRMVINAAYVQSHGENVLQAGKRVQEEKRRENELASVNNKL